MCAKYIMCDTEKLGCDGNLFNITITIIIFNPLYIAVCVCGGGGGGGGGGTSDMQCISQDQCVCKNIL